MNRDKTNRDKTIEQYISNIKFGNFAIYQMLDKYADPLDKQEIHAEATWHSICRRVTHSVVSPHFPQIADKIIMNMARRRICPGGRYLYAAGRRLENGQVHKVQQINNCMLFRVDDSREGWADLARKVVLSLMTGAGIGVDYSALRPAGQFLKGTGGHSSGALAAIMMINEIARYIRFGGVRRAACFGMLNWLHGDAISMIEAKNWSDETKAMKARDFNFPAPLDGTNISIGLDDLFFEAYHDPTHQHHEHAHKIYWESVKSMLNGAEPGFTIDIGENAGETLRNACTEITSRDDSDVCNLGHINMARCRNLDEFRECVHDITLLLLCGTLYGSLPFEEVYETRKKNRRLGVGLMGVATWQALRGYQYGPNPELEEWLHYYKTDTKYWADYYSEKLGINAPIKTRAIAPTGTTSIVCETSSGIEPVFCVAYKRWFYTRDTTGKEVRQYQYVIDSLAKMLIDIGVKPGEIEDAYSLSNDVERRLDFQAYIQRYVDHGISSTVNLPSHYHGPEYTKKFGDILIKRLPELRGITTYRDGCRAGQPLEPVPYEEALGKEGQVFEDHSDKSCTSGICGM